MPAAVSITIANRQKWEKTLADYARACHKTLEYSALRGARNWTIRGARKFRAFQEDSPAIVLSDGSRRSAQIISYRLRKKAEAGRGLDIRREDGRLVIVTTKGRKRVREVRYAMPRGAYFSREYAREYATRQYRAMMGHRGFVRVLPWRVCAALDQRLSALGESTSRKVRRPPARKVNAGEVHVWYRPGDKVVRLAVVAVYDYATDHTLAQQDNASATARWNREMAYWMAKALPETIRDMQGYIAKKLKERREGRL